MKTFKNFFILLIFFAVPACTMVASHDVVETPQVSNTVTPPVQPTDMIEIPTFTNDGLPTLSALPTIAFPTFDANATPMRRTPSPDELPDFEISQIPGLLTSAFQLESLPDFQGYAIQKISGWDWGFDRFRWLDENHLLLYPYAGLTNALTDRTLAGTYPAVMNLGTQQTWAPYLSFEDVDRRASLSWSPELGVLIVPGVDQITLYDPDGNQKGSHAGELRSVSPSATKIMVDDDIWVDLKSGKTVDFAWSLTGLAADPIYVRSNYAWSPDEKKVYRCCYVYGNASTSVSFVMPFDAATLDGKKVEEPLLAMSAKWVFDDKYVLPWGGWWEGPLFSILLFDPAAKTFRDIGTATGVHAGTPNGVEPNCNVPSAQNGGRYLWVDCIDGGHLVDLANLTAETFPPFGRPYGENTFLTPEHHWSADGTYVWFELDPTSSILSVDSKEMKSLPENCGGYDWHPTENILLCSSDHGRKIVLWDAKTLQVQKELLLPVETRQRAWSVDGKHIALLARDNSIWRIDYPNLDQLEQLTAAAPEWDRPIPNTTYVDTLVQQITWSADGSQIAFIVAPNVYIVDAHADP